MEEVYLYGRKRRAFKILAEQDKEIPLREG